MPDVYVICDDCKGTRFGRETLEVMYCGKNIAEILNLTINEACEMFAGFPALKSRLLMLKSVGLGYLSLGQPATILSGGEAQRMKLSRELGKSDPLILYIYWTSQRPASISMIYRN